MAMITAKIVLVDGTELYPTLSHAEITHRLGEPATPGFMTVDSHGANVTVNIAAIAAIYWLPAGADPRREG